MVKRRKLYRFQRDTDTTCGVKSGEHELYRTLQLQKARKTTRKNINNHIHPIPYLYIIPIPICKFLVSCFIRYFCSYFEPQPEVCATEEPWIVSRLFWMLVAKQEVNKVHKVWVQRKSWWIRVSFLFRSDLVIERPPGITTCKGLDMFGSLSCDHAGLILLDPTYD